MGSNVERPVNGHALPPLEGAEAAEAIREAAANLSLNCADETDLTPGRRGGPGSRLIRGAQRARLIRLARRGKFREAMFDYYPGIPHNVSLPVNAATRRGYAAWLVVTATRNGVHSATSLHKSGRAVDLGNIVRHIGPTAEGRRRLVAHQGFEFNEWRRGKRQHLQELIGPDNNMVVLRGRHCPLPEGSPLENQHDNHVHVGFFS